MTAPNKLSAVLIATAFITLLSVFPFLNLINLLCCAGVVLGGFIGTSHYGRQLRNANEEINFKDGIAIGILSGVVSALVVIIFSTLLSMLLKQNPIPEMSTILEQYGFRMPQESEEILRRISDEYNKNGFSITLTIANLIFDLIAYPIFSSIGGMLAVTMFRKRKSAEQ